MSVITFVCVGFEWFQLRSCNLFHHFFQRFPLTRNASKPYIVPRHYAINGKVSPNSDDSRMLLCALSPHCPCMMVKGRNHVSVSVLKDVCKKWNAFGFGHEVVLSLDSESRGEHRNRRH
eukprot:6464077-Amphidinium_carterae.1